MRHSVRAALDPVDPFANKMGLVDRLSPQAAKAAAEAAVVAVVVEAALGEAVVAVVVNLD